jgi:HEAT repeat protein
LWAAICQWICGAGNSALGGKYMSAIEQALAKLRKAKSIDEGDDGADELAKAARQNLDEVIELFYTTQSDTFALVWCLQGLTRAPIIELYKQALKDKDSQVRWAAIEGLKYAAQASLIPVFVAALKDRSHMVKAVAVDWLKAHGDASAIAPLERLLRLPGLIKTSPGTVKQIEKAVKHLRTKAT